MRMLTKLTDAIIEAERFIRRARAAKEELIADKASKEYRCRSNKQAAAKRASMDLSNALAELRKTGNWER